jgi:hypothetical protein
MYSPSRRGRQACVDVVERTEIEQRFDEILADLEGVAGWQTARVRRPVMILGSLDGIETGARQRKRKRATSAAKPPTRRASFFGSSGISGCFSLATMHIHTLAGRLSGWFMPSDWQSAMFPHRTGIRRFAYQ